MEIKEARYVITAIKPEQYPVHDLPEIALVGRSNVGKSSLINTLLNRKNLARVAAAPGKTREINFYQIDRALYLTDLPGYGYARVSKSEKACWGEMIETYLQSRTQLKLILMVVDIRHTPTADDQLIYRWINGQGKAYLVVASKSDKIPRGRIGNRLQEIRTILDMRKTESLTPFSAVTKEGRKEIWIQINKIIDKLKP